MLAIPDEPKSPAPPPHVILVVDDEVLVRLVIADYLRDCGFHVFEAADGLEAVEILECSDRAIDLVLSDVQMPRRDGFALAHWLREHRPHVPIILTSGNHADAAAKATALCHQGPVIAKPFDHARLLQRIRRMLARASDAGAG